MNDRGRLFPSSGIHVRRPPRDHGQRSMVLGRLLLLHDAYQDHDAHQNLCICRMRKLIGIAK